MPPHRAGAASPHAAAGRAQRETLRDAGPGHVLPSWCGHGCSCCHQSLTVPNLHAGPCRRRVRVRTPPGVSGKGDDCTQDTRPPARPRARTTVSATATGVCRGGGWPGSRPCTESPAAWGGTEFGPWPVPRRRAGASGESAKHTVWGLWGHSAARAGGGDGGSSSGVGKLRRIGGRAGATEAPIGCSELGVPYCQSQGVA